MTMAWLSNRQNSALSRRWGKRAATAIILGAMLVPAVSAQDRYSNVRQLLDTRQYEQALKQLQSMQGGEEADSELYLLLARAYLETGAGIAAEASVERARRMGADYAGTATLFAKALLLQGKYNDALAAIRGVTIAPEHRTTAFIISGDALFALQRLKDAQQNYNQARQSDPENFQAYLGLARLELRAGNLLKAQELIAKAAEYGAGNTMVHYTWGLVARYLGKPGEAEQHFLEARRLFPENIMANIELASIRIDEGALEEAEKYLDAVYAVAPNYPMALYLSGVILASRGQFEEAYSLLNRARNITDTYLPAIYIRGLVAYQLGHYVDAETQLRRVLQASPQSRPVRMALAGTYLRLSRPAAAFETLQPLLEAGKPDANVIAIAAAAAMAAGRLEEGHALYELLAEEEQKEPHDVVEGLTSKLALARFVAGNTGGAIDAIMAQADAKGIDVRELGVLGNLQLRSGDLEGARLTVAKILAALPERALGYNMRGTLEYTEGKYAEALASFTRAIELNKDYYTAIRNKALAALQLGQHQNAERDLKRLLSTQPTDARAKAILGRALLLQGKGEEAVPYFEEAIRLIPGSADLEADYAAALALAGHTSRAIEQAREAAVLAADQPGLLKRMGQLLLDLNQARLAVRPLSRYVAFDPDNGEAHLLHGRALLAMGLATGARISFERAGQARKNVPDQGMLDWYLFAIDSLSRKYPAALKIMRGLDPAKRPEDIRASVIGDTLMATGQVEAAISAYKAAMGSSNASDVVIGLAGAYEHEGRSQSAVEVLEDHLKANPGDRAARMKLGGLFETMGLPSAATEQYEAVLRAGVADAHVVARLARAYLRLGNRKSVPLAERAYLIMPEDPFVLDIYGWVMLQAKRDIDTAEMAISKATRRAPSVALYRYHLAMTYLARGRREEALETLRQAVKLDPDFEEVEDAKRQIELLE